MALLAKLWEAKYIQEMTTLMHLTDLDIGESLSKILHRQLTNSPNKQET